MIWQDIVFTIGGFIFAVLLIPTLIDSDAQVPRLTSIPTALILVIFSLTYFSLGFYYSTITNLMTAGCWAGISIWRSPEE